MEADTVVAYDGVAIHGFSNPFELDKKVEVMDLQFIEGEELERKWREARRQRLKQQEEKIWSEFINEQGADLVKTCEG